MLVNVHKFINKSNTPMTEQKNRKTKGVSTAFDKNVGERVRVIRKLRGLSQEQLSQSLGVTYQQLQKYEQGHNRISCSRLKDLSTALQVEPEFFLKAHPAEKLFSNENDPFAMIDGQTAELVRIFGNIKSKKIKSAIVKIVKTHISGQNE